MKSAGGTTVAAIFLIACAFLAGCNDVGAGPQDWLLGETLGFYARVPATNIWAFDSFAASGEAKIYWRTGVGIDPPILNFAEVRLYLSSTSPDGGFLEILRRSGSGEDSTVVDNLRNGIPFYFRVATFDSAGIMNSLSRPIVTIPWEPEVSSFSTAAPQREVGEWMTSLDWSHDGERLAFLRTINNSVNVFVLRVLNGSVQQLTHYSGMDYRLLSVHWSPDDQTISYCYTPTSTAGSLDYRIWLVPAAGGASRSVTAGRVDGGEVWESSTHLIFTKGTIGPPNIPEFYRVDLADGNRETPIVTDPSMRKYTPSLNQTRGLMVFRGFPNKPGGSAGLYTVPPAGGAPSLLTSSPHWSDIHPSWSADGERIYFASSRSGHYEIWSVDVQSKELRQITRSQIRGINRYNGADSPSALGLAVLEVGSQYSGATIRALSLR